MMYLFITCISASLYITQLCRIEMYILVSTVLICSMDFCKFNCNEFLRKGKGVQTSTKQACPKLRGELENSDFELRWEFLVTNESHEEWQLMSKEMNDALEKRWAQGWDGDNGKLGGIVSNF